MEGDVGHTGGLTNPRPWRGRCRAGFFNTSGPPLPRERAPLQKKTKNKAESAFNRSSTYISHISLSRVFETFRTRVFSSF